MVAGVGPADGRRVLPSLPCRSEAVRAGAGRGASRKPAHRLEVQTKLADVIRHLADSVGAGARGRGCVGGGVAV